MAIVNIDGMEEPDGPKIVGLVDTGTVGIKNTVLPYKEEEEYVAITSRDKKLDNIVQYINGEEWTVEYFLQAITENDEIGRFDPDQPDTLSQYIKIKQLLLFVDSPLTQDDANNITGSAYINAGVTPNSGDVFTAVLLGKRKALFRVESVEKKTYNLNNVYLIEYKVDMFLDADTTLLRELNKKVVKTYFYDRNFLESNSTPLLLENKYNNKRIITGELNNIINFYIETMYNKERSILSIPGQSSVIIDPRLQEFIFKIIDTNDNPLISKISRISIDDEYLKQPTVLDAMIERDLGILNVSNIKYSTVDTVNFSRNVRLRSIAYLGIKYVVYPYDIDKTVVESTNTNVSEVNVIEPVDNPHHRDINFEDKVVIKEYDKDSKYYIFSEAFYKDDAENMSLLEGAVRLYLLNEVNDDRLIIKFIDSYKYWNRVEQFFYIPILILLIRDAIDRSFSVT